MNANASARTGDRLTFEDLDSNNNLPNIKGYFALSTAPINVDHPQSNENETSLSQEKEIKSQEDGINEIADFLNATEEQKEKELVIMIHGYNTEKHEVKQQYNSIFTNLNNEYRKAREYFENKKLVFIGYRWPSEKFFNHFPEYFSTALKTLPIPFIIINNFLYCTTFLIFGLILFSTRNREFLGIGSIFIFLLSAFVNLVFLLFGFKIQKKIKSLFDGLFLILFIVSIVWFVLLCLQYVDNLQCLFNSYLCSDSQDFLKNFVPQEFYIIINIIMFIILGFSFMYLGVIITFIFLRSTVYFRDKYRAMFFAVADLVSLIKNLNYQVKSNKKISISLIGHSMGAFVATHTIRTLCNAFENNNGEDNESQYTSKNKPTIIGDTFYLGRLVLVSPDISIQAIFPGKSNVLETAINKCQEAYLFSNQGDIILRVFSVISNYFRFPANSAERGFRLGNIAINENQQSSDNDYNKRHINGIIIPQNQDHLLNILSIVYRGKQHSIYDLTRDSNNSNESYKITQQFTYFDCTDYQENGRSFLTLTKKNKRLGVWDDIELGGSYIINSRWVDFIYSCLTQKEKQTFHKDVHGGYFEGEFCQKMIYGLACLGFDDFLKFINLENSKAASYQDKFDYFSQKCEEYRIQGVLSPKLAERLNDKSSLNVNLVNVKYEIMGTASIIIHLDSHLS